MRSALALLTCLLVPLGAGVMSAVADEEAAAEARVRNGADLSKRLSSGPVVIRGKVVDDSIKATVEIVEIYRAPGEIPRRIEIAYRGLNASRRTGTPRFEVMPDEEAVFVLERWTDYYGELGDEDLYQPAWDYRSRIPIPPEGRQAMLEAIEALVRFKDADSRERAEGELRSWLGGRNPWLIEAALSHAATYGPADGSWTRALVEHAQSPDPTRRRLALTAMGLGLSRGRLGVEPGAAGSVGREDRRNGLDQRELCRRALIQAARTDADPEVRRVAVRALGRSGLDGVRSVLEVIASNDENQEVRYEAETILLERR
jgi:hypothetical protein